MFTNISTDAKIISATILVSSIILIGGFYFASRQSAPAVPQEQIVTSDGLHWHPKLTITINGERQKIPPEIGLGAVHGKIHTHKEDAKDGVVHMEASGVVTKDDTKLDRFFRAWGKEFNSTKILDKTNGEGGKIKMLVNGKENKDFENYLMKDKDIIEITYK